MDVCWLAVRLTVTVTQDDCAEKPRVSRVASVEPSFSRLLLFLSGAHEQRAQSPQLVELAALGVADA
jgi:hypothetical protein